MPRNSSHFKPWEQKSHLLLAWFSPAVRALLTQGVALLPWSETQPKKTRTWKIDAAGRFGSASSATTNPQCAESTLTRLEGKIDLALKTMVCIQNDPGWQRFWRYKPSTEILLVSDECTSDSVLALVVTTYGSTRKCISLPAKLRCTVTGKKSKWHCPLFQVQIECWVDSGDSFTAAVKICDVISGCDGHIFNRF